MGFLAPLLPAIIGGASSAGVSYGLSKLGGGGGESPKSAAEQVLTEQTKFGTETAKRLIPEAETDLQAALKYWMPLLTGDRQGMMEAAAPEVNTILSQYDTAKRAVSELQPRGGARSLRMAEQPFDVAGAITNLLTRLRGEAAGGVERIGTELGALGVGTMAGGAGAAQSLLTAAMQQRGQNIGIGTTVGQGIGSLIAVLLGRSDGGGGGTLGLDMEGEPLGG